jgi:hypothetical protein
MKLRPTLSILSLIHFAAACSSSSVPEGSTPVPTSPSDAVTAGSSPTAVASLRELTASTRPLRFAKVISVNGKAFLTRSEAPSRTVALPRLGAPEAKGPHAHLDDYPMWLVDPKPYEGQTVTVISDPPCVTKPTTTVLHAVLPVELLASDPKSPVDLAKLPMRWREVAELPGCAATGDRIAVFGDVQRAQLRSEPKTPAAATEQLPSGAVIHTALELDGRTLFVAAVDASDEPEVVIELEGDRLVRVGTLEGTERTTQAQ